MLTNKHVIIALLVAPILSILAWFGVGKLLGEQPHAAVAGQVYSLLERSNCRYASGRCDLANGDVELALELLSPDTAPLLELQSNITLQGVMLAVVPGGTGEQPPRPMTASDANGTLWRLPLAGRFEEGDRLRLVAATDSNQFTAEISTQFSRVED